MTASSPSLRVALLGLGRIGFQFHGPAVRATPGFRFVAALDPLAERRTEVEALWQVRTYADLPDLLRAEQPDLVVVASPTPWHAEQTVAALRAGAHVLCDKPVARSVAEFDEMAAAATAARRKLVAYQPHRLSRRVRALRELVRSGKLGDIHQVRVVRWDYRRRNDWQAFTAHGGGMLNNYASHAIDEVVAGFGVEAIRSLRCETRRIASLGDAEDVVKALIVTAGGRIIDLDISQAAALDQESTSLEGSRGAAMWSREKQAWLVRWYDAREAAPLLPQDGQAAAGRSYNPDTLPWRAEEFTVPEVPAFSYYEAVHAHVLHDAPPPVSLAETRHVLDVIARCRAAANAG